MQTEIKLPAEMNEAIECAVNNNFTRDEDPELWDACIEWAKRTVCETGPGETWDNYDHTVNDIDMKAWMFADGFNAARALYK